MIRSILAAVLRAAFTLLGVALATGLVVFGLLMAGTLALFAKLTGRPILFRRLRPQPFGARPTRARPAAGGDVIDAEVREVRPGAEAATVVELPPARPPQH
jgi:hypothetical protein